MQPRHSLPLAATLVGYLLVMILLRVLAAEWTVVCTAGLPKKAGAPPCCVLLMCVLPLPHAVPSSRPAHRPSARAVLLQVHAVVSRLIADDGLPASHDQPTGTIVVHHVEPTRLQTLAGAFGEKAALLVDLNERALAMRTGALHTEDDDGDGRGGHDGGRGGRGRSRMGRGGGPGGFGGRGGRCARGDCLPALFSGPCSCAQQQVEDSCQPAAAAILRACVAC